MLIGDDISDSDPIESDLAIITRKMNTSQRRSVYNKNMIKTFKKVAKIHNYARLIFNACPGKNMNEPNNNMEEPMNNSFRHSDNHKEQTIYNSFNNSEELTWTH